MKVLDIVNVMLAHHRIDGRFSEVKWESNSAGVITVCEGPFAGQRIGDFQGDAKLAEFVVLAHEAARNAPICATKPPVTELMHG